MCCFQFEKVESRAGQDITPVTSPVCLPVACSRDTNRPQLPAPQRQSPGSRVAAGRSRAGKPELHSFIHSFIRVHSCPFVVQKGLCIRVHSWFKTPPQSLAIIRENPCQSVAKNTPHPWRCCPCGDRKPIAGGSLATCWRADWPSSIRSWRSGA